MPVTTEAPPTGAGQWTALTLDLPEAYADAVANFLIECGSPGVESTAAGDTVRVTAYFADTPPLDALRRYCDDLGCALAPDGSVPLTTRSIAAAAWADNWKLYAQPQCIGERLYVAPSWAPDPPPGRVAVVLDPGMAFGTGQHATTRGCLRQLERVTAARPIARALDVGTGSGILAIALARLGVAEVWAVDTDPTACAVAAANAAANGVAAGIHVVDDLAAAAGPFDLVVANLYADLLEAMAPELHRLLAPRGEVVLSGLLVADEARVCAAFERLGLRRTAREVEESWVTFVLASEPAP